MSNIFTIIILMLPLLCSSQTIGKHLEEKLSTNRVSNSLEKTEFWIENVDNVVQFGNYSCGLRNGIWIEAGITLNRLFLYKQDSLVCEIDFALSKCNIFNKERADLIFRFAPQTQDVPRKEKWEEERYFEYLPDVEFWLTNIEGIGFAQSIDSRDTIASVQIPSKDSAFVIVNFIKRNNVWFLSEIFEIDKGFLNGIHYSYDLKGETNSLINYEEGWLEGETMIFGETKEWKSYDYHKGKLEKSSFGNIDETFNLIFSGYKGYFFPNRLVYLNPYLEIKKYFAENLYKGFRGCNKSDKIYTKSRGSGLNGG